MLSLEELEQLLALGHESRSFEVKGPGSMSDTAFVAKVAKAAMAMGNLRDGGVVCLGIDDTQMAQMQPGLEAAQAEEWLDYDNVADALAKYSDPPVSFELQRFQLSNGNLVVVLEVAEFDQSPHICKKDYEKELRRGGTYVRPRGKPESVHVPTHAEMRELLDRAIDKGVREFIRRAQEGGVMLGTFRTPEEVEREEYETEAAVAWGQPSDALDAVLLAGHFDVAVRPTSWQEGRLSPPELEAFVANNAVRLRGWPVPFVENAPVVRRAGSVGQDIEPRSVPHLEAWRMCTSGQFLHRRVFASDISESDSLRAWSEDVDGAMVVWDVLFYLVEVVEFGARMATAMELQGVTFDVALRNLGTRELVSGDRERELMGPYVLAAADLIQTVDIATPRLVVQPRAVGVELAQSFLREFGLDVPDKVLYDWQASDLRQT